MGADFGLDVWRYYGNEKLSDVDIILAEEEPETSHQQPSYADVIVIEDNEDKETAVGSTGTTPDHTQRAGPATAAAGETDGKTAGSQSTGAAASGAAGAEQAAAARDPATTAVAAAATVTAVGSSSDNPAVGNPPPAAPAAAAKDAAAAAAAAAVPVRSSKRKRQEAEHIFGHSFVLCAFSGYCRTKLEDWDEATAIQCSCSGRARHEIQLLVPAGQLELGRLLIKGMYQQRPDLSDVSQAQLIQLLLLADRFEVPKVQAAVSAAFKALPLEQLQWDTVVAVYALPAGCAELAACQDLFSAAAAKLQHELGDLELALTEAESSKARQLLGLPFGALKQLLQDERTRVASENTVFLAFCWWHKYQQQQIKAKCSEQWQRAQQQESLKQQAQELLQLVRMPQCSHLFIASVVGQEQLAARCFSRSDLLLASQFGRSAFGQRALPLHAADLPVFQRHPAWLLPARPPSAMKQLTFDWQLPLAQLKQAFERHLESGRGAYLWRDGKVWQALALCPMMHISSDSSDGSINRRLEIYCYALKLMGSDSTCRSASKIAFRVKSFKQGARDVSYRMEALLFTDKCSSWGWNNAVRLGLVSSWAEAEVALRNQGLVGGDGCLHLTMTVSGVE